MKKKFSGLTLLFCCILSAFIAFTATFFGYQQAVNRTLSDVAGIKTKYAKLIRLEEILRRNFVFDIDDRKLADWTLSGLVYGLEDDYSYYMDAETYANMSAELEGNFVGIGVRVNYAGDSGLIRIIQVMKGSPAEAAGLMPGDLITVVEGEDVVDVGYDAAVDKMLGKEGTTAAFTVSREGEVLEFSVTRASFATTTVEYRMLDSGYGYIQIQEFDYPTYEQFETALEDLTAQGAKGFVFDVRNNSGGELGTICDILDLLVPKGNIIEIVYKDGTMETETSDAREINLPLAVLINGETYSAAELFAATLRDYNKALLVGEKTFGKGCMQTVFPLGDDTAVNLTNALYNPPSGKNYHGIGVFPHIEAKLPEELRYKAYYLTYDEDVQLQRAVAALEAGDKPENYTVRYE
ncbi:MAG TPA: S41 family peptidase [Candidatus Acidoferrum sp.]|nr:S41 family peptidase [Candidatus Acidoferrum sp.]